MEKAQGYAEDIRSEAKEKQESIKDLENRTKELSQFIKTGEELMQELIDTGGETASQYSASFGEVLRLAKQQRDVNEKAARLARTAVSQAQKEAGAGEKAAEAAQEKTAKPEQKEAEEKQEAGKETEDKKAPKKKRARGKGVLDRVKELFTGFAKRMSEIGKDLRNNILGIVSGGRENAKLESLTPEAFENLEAEADALNKEVEALAAKEAAKKEEIAGEKESRMTEVSEQSVEYIAGRKDLSERQKIEMVAVMAAERGEVVHAGLGESTLSFSPENAGGKEKTVSVFVNGEKAFEIPVTDGVFGSKVNADAITAEDAHKIEDLTANAKMRPLSKEEVQAAVSKQNERIAEKERELEEIQKDLAAARERKEPEKETSKKEAPQQEKPEKQKAAEEPEKEKPKAEKRPEKPPKNFYTFKKAVVDEQKTFHSEGKNDTNDRIQDLYVGERAGALQNAFKRAINQARQNPGNPIKTEIGNYTITAGRGLKDDPNPEKITIDNGTFQKTVPLQFYRKKSEEYADYPFLKQGDATKFSLWGKILRTEIVGDPSPAWSAQSVFMEGGTNPTDLNAAVWGIIEGSEIDDIRGTEDVKAVLYRDSWKDVGKESLSAAVQTVAEQMESELQNGRPGKAYSAAEFVYTKGTVPEYREFAGMILEYGGERFEKAAMEAGYDVSRQKQQQARYMLVRQGTSFDHDPEIIAEAMEDIFHGGDANEINALQAAMKNRGYTAENIEPGMKEYVERACAGRDAKELTAENVSYVTQDGYIIADDGNPAAMPDPETGEYAFYPAETLGDYAPNLISELIGEGMIEPEAAGFAMVIEEPEPEEWEIL